MNNRARSVLQTFIAVLCLMAAGCALPHAVYHIEIIVPHDLSIIQMPPASIPFWVSIAPTTTSSRLHITGQVQITTTLTDNGRQVQSFSTIYSGLDRGWGGATIPWSPTTPGEHVLSATVHVVDSQYNSNFNLMATSRVCVVSSLTHPTQADRVCISNTVYDIIFSVYPDTAQQSSPLSAPITPSPTSIPVPPSTLTPTATLAPYIPPIKAPSGCKSYTNQNDCAQNGCFWQFSTNTCHAKANSCSGYKDASSCTTNGCSWDKGSSTCH